MSFTFEPGRTRVVFGRGTVSSVRAEVERLGAKRVLLIARHGGDKVAAELGPLLVTRFTGATMHTPVEVTERALVSLREHGADCIVSVGGGSSTGLSKALSVRAGVPQIIIPTTYAGSEVTQVLGETADGLKKTRRDPAIQPGTVIYDVELTLDLPLDVTVTSALNSLAHAVAARGNENPLIDAIATKAIEGVLHALSGNPSTVDARTELLSSAWLAGTCLASVPMGLHHKLAHVLGGSFGLPHAATHTALLPHTAPSDLAARIHDTATRFGAVTSLRELGMAESDLSRAAEIAGHPDAQRVLTNAWRDATSD
ncbi:Alcohol dehydrogenase, class IV [Lentzea waywayandensis]|uniref:Alcohol dehydrogenase, class IV n=1 Tax=Lentzea waywayandensis TaxID=84724 RepID=A0A1I6ERT6_9PSEU|nr:maleylacetate reductase [Lentzea waywayandensis]SFR20450.1 Alcohol dehydrogenase, class IV [Lentzea waywayandensis]